MGGGGGWSRWSKASGGVLGLLGVLRVSGLIWGFRRGFGGSVAGLDDLKCHNVNTIPGRSSSQAFALPLYFQWGVRSGNLYQIRK